MGMIDNKGLAKLEWSLDKCFEVAMVFSITKDQAIAGVQGVAADVVGHGITSSKLCGVGIHEGFI